MSANGYTHDHQCDHCNGHHHEHPAKIPKATYRKLGRSGLRVSVPIIGAMSFGDKRWQNWVIEEHEVRSWYAETADG